MKVRRKSDREHYYAALERKAQARVLYDKGHYGYSIYTSGLAVECMFSAFIIKRYPDHSFNEGHDLKELLKNSRLLEVLRPKQHIKLNRYFQVVYINWHNSFRFSSDFQIKEQLIKRYKKQGIKGNIIKFASLETMESAAKIIDRGVLEWEKC